METYDSTSGLFIDPKDWLTISSVDSSARMTKIQFRDLIFMVYVLTRESIISRFCVEELELIYSNVFDRDLRMDYDLYCSFVPVYENSLKVNS